MRIGEAAELTGLSISNIRFYEKKGLLDPERDQQSKYRDYSPEDICRLKEILLYRKMDIPIETIALLLNRKTTLEQALEEQMRLLKEKQEMLQGSIDLCEAVMGNASADRLDVEFFLNYVKTEESKGRKFAEIEEMLADFASYTKFDMVAADPVFSGFFRNPKLAGAARIIWSVVLLLLPVIGIADSCLSENGISPVMILYWIVMIAALWGSFVRFRRKWRE